MSETRRRLLVNRCKPKPFLSAIITEAVKWIPYDVQQIKPHYRSLNLADRGAL